MVVSEDDIVSSSSVDNVVVDVGDQVVSNNWGDHFG